MYNFHDAVLRAYLLRDNPEEQLVQQTANTPNILLQVTRGR